MGITADRAWLERMQDMHLLQVAAALGLRCAAARGASGGSIYGCPVCGAECRHATRRDRRGALGVRHDGTGFRCMDCDLSGDSIDLVALVLRGKRYRELGTAARDEVREWCSRFTGVEVVPGSAPAPATAPAQYPLEAEVRNFWDCCVPVDTDSAVGEYLTRRKVWPKLVTCFDLARALPEDKAAPAWASRWNMDLGRSMSWAETGHRLIVPLFDERGLMRSVLARSVDGTAQSKSLAPSSFGRAGLLMADGFGRWLLATGQRPEWWLAGRELRLVVAEGETDFLGWATQWSDAAEFAPATFAVVSGSWCADVAARVPDGTTVVIATDNDKAGDRYASTIVDTFTGRAVTLERWEASA
jgi:hypothetical protein